MFGRPGSASLLRASLIMSKSDMTSLIGPLLERGPCCRILPGAGRLMVRVAQQLLTARIRLRAWPRVRRAWKLWANIWRLGI
jgi:hypothetical protein|eukprot:COSAG02_NODE_5960_length_3909_cov_2.654331_3_plen_82_part_00